MRAYTGPAELQWAANPHLVLSETVELVVSETPDGWDARLRGEGEGFELLRKLDGPHDLVFPDGSGFSVTVEVDVLPERPLDLDQPTTLASSIVPAAHQPPSARASSRQRASHRRRGTTDAALWLPS